MYEEFFGFSYKPFRLSPRLDAVYLSPQHKEALSVLEYSVYESAGGITVLTGGVGSGKTTVLNFLLHRLGSAELNFGVINNSHPQMQSVFDYIALGFDAGVDESSVTARQDEVIRYLKNTIDRGQQSVLFVDEAQNLPFGVLEQLRLFNNRRWSGKELLKFILVGQPELLHKFENKMMAPLVQRVSLEAHITPLNLRQTKIYIQFLLRRAGRSAAIFDSSAFLAIHLLTGGVPRLINTLCDRSLMLAFESRLRRVDLSIIVAATNNNPITSRQFDTWNFNDYCKKIGLKGQDRQQLPSSVI